jgi:hypothetical protein
MASWFSEGTVSVQNGSPTVTGVGTKFSNCRAGDMFVGPDQGIYQVINPASDTSLSISPAYRGAAVGGAGYGIVPVNGYPKALADAVNQMVQQWGATLAGLGDVSTQDVVPVAMGGTGGRNPAEGRSGLGLGTAATASVTVGNSDTTAGRVLKVGDFGVGADSVVIADWNEAYDNLGGAFIAGNAAYPGGTGEAINATGISLRRAGRVGAQLMVYNGDNQLLFRSAYNGFLPWVRVYHTGNTTRMADNTLRAI